MEVAGMAEVEAGVLAFEIAVAGAMRAAGGEIASLLANYAKTNHPWTPRTGATDVSTKGTVVEATAEFVTIVLSAGMTYDVFLEFARQGKWAWLGPAVEACKPQILESLGRHLFAVGSTGIAHIASAEGFSS